MNQAIYSNENSPIRYKNGIMMLRAKSTVCDSEKKFTQNHDDNDLNVITPLHREKLRYVIRGL